MTIYKKQVKRHEEVCADVPDYGECRVKVCIGNSNYGRFYATQSEEEGGYCGVWLSDGKTAEAYNLFKEICEKNKDNNSFGWMTQR